MQLTLLRVSNLRGFEAAEWRPAPGANLVTGANGAGKTSLLEAAHLLAHGRSFRGRVRDGLVRQGATALEIYAEWRDGSGAGRRAGLRHGGAQWEARIDGESAPTLAALCAAVAVTSFEPGSHELITGGAESRRRFLDWTLFHVEPEFLPTWRRYARALRQRNALLKTGPTDAALAAWDDELAGSGEGLHALRAAQLDAWRPLLLAALEHSLGELGAPTLMYLPGWRASERSLRESLQAGRERDRALGYTASGPHRADWRVDFPGLPGRDGLSRGQTKLLALAAVLSQATQFAAVRGEWPVIALDDLGSELDREHQERVLSGLKRSGAQLLLTGTEPPAGLGVLGEAVTRFHVEHGAVARQSGPRLSE